MKNVISNKGAKTSRNHAAKRSDEILEAAAKLFSENGYTGTSVRDIAAAVGMLSGSIYYHFESKQEILRKVHLKGVQQVMMAVEQAVDACDGDDWHRLSVACEAHMTALLDSNPFSQIITPQFTRVLEADLQTELIQQRDKYEQLFAKLIASVPVPPNINRRYFRLALLGSLNWSLTWYRPDGDNPAEICRHMLDVYRFKLDPSA